MVKLRSALPMKSTQNLEVYEHSWFNENEEADVVRGMGSFIGESNN